MSHPSEPCPRPVSKARAAGFNSTYRSFSGIEVFESVSPRSRPHPTVQDTLLESQSRSRSGKQDQHKLASRRIRCKDQRRMSCCTSSTANPWLLQRRTSTRRARAKCSSKQSLKAASISAAPTHDVESHPHDSYHAAQPSRPPAAEDFHFPLIASRPSLHVPSPDHHHYQTASEQDPATSFRTSSPLPKASPPPQTTYYWTTDATRQLEYAAIDAASRGVRGWVFRNLVPSCFVIRERQRTRFEDDRDSVARHWLDRSGGREEKKDPGRRDEKMGAADEEKNSGRKWSWLGLRRGKRL